MKDYDEFAAKIDELNDVGNAYDATLRGADSKAVTPIRRSMTSLYSALSILTLYKHH